MISCDRGNMQPQGCSSVPRKCHLQSMSQRREAIKILANSWSSGSRHAVGVEREMEEEEGGKGGRQNKSGRASME